MKYIFHYIQVIENFTIKILSLQENCTTICLNISKTPQSYPLLTYFYIMIIYYINKRPR